MKHDFKVISILALVFFLSQLIGLAVINGYIDHKLTEETGEVEFSTLPYDIERPEVEGNQSLYFILAAILIGTVLILFIIKIKKFFLWKIWFFISVFITLLIAFASFSFIQEWFAAALALALALWKIQKPNIYIHNLTEIFIYGGLAAIFVPMISMFSIVVLLIIISIYDMYAVWHSKHMIKMAEFQAKSKVFAGVVIPYTPSKEEKSKKEEKIKERELKREKIRRKEETSEKSIKKEKLAKKEKTKINKKIESSYLAGQKLKRHMTRNAVVGGGDLGFPLLFAGVVMKKLMLLYPVAIGFLLAVIIPIIVTLSLFLLLYYGKKDRFYPAMPFLTAGCFVGYAVILILQTII